LSFFGSNTLKHLHDAREISICTQRHPDTAVVIWVVAAGEEVYVRSVRAAQGRWFKDLALGGEATLEVAGQRVPVTAIPVTDPDAIERASQEYRRKYRGSPYVEAMVRAEALHTTLRLEPR
jgi:hypothetical protein